MPPKGWTKETKSKSKKKKRGKPRQVAKLKIEAPPLLPEKEAFMPEAQEVKIEERPPLKANASVLDIIRAAKRVNIIIDEQENHEGANDVRLGIEGYVINIQRGKEVAIPEPFIHVLEDAKYTIISKNDNGEDTERQVPRYNWRRV